MTNSKYKFLTYNEEQKEKRSIKTAKHNPWGNI